MPSRRAVVASAAVVLSGCTGDPLPGRSGTPDLDEHVPDEWRERPARGLADGVKTTIDLEDEVEFYPDREVVRPADEYRPADEWLAGRCPYVARRPVKDRVRTRLDDPDGVREVGVRPDERELHVYRKVVLDREGDVLSAPDVTFEAVREATPEFSHTTVTLGDFEHTCELSAFVQDLVVQYE
ncbi:hypothetical protein [Haloparvum sp. AD34]